jgi:phosphate transport system permease protein
LYKDTGNNMTDISARAPAGIDSTASQRARIARRYAAERRFRLYGILAILVTAVFLVVLFADIFSKGLPAFIEHRLQLTISADAATIDPENSRDPAKIRGGDFNGLIRSKLSELLPAVTTRADRRALNGLLSSGAADEFRNMVVANPALLGTDVAVPVLFSDDADQYFKGYQTETGRRPGGSALQMAAEGDSIRLSTPVPEFRSALAALKVFAAERLQHDSDELERLNSLIAGRADDLQAIEARAASGDAGAVAERDKLSSDIASLTGTRDQLKTIVDNLAVRVSKAAGAEALDATLPSLFVEVNGGVLKVVELSELSALATPVLVPNSLAPAASGGWSILELSTPESNRRTTDKEAVWLEHLKVNGFVESGFAWRFLTSGDSREAELAGIFGALTGSIFTLLVTLALCLPIGVGAAVYLEEFAPKNRLTDLIEVNINNLAAVPSIVFGLLGLAMFLNFFGLPRSAPLVGGLVLALLVLPTIIIASRAALKAVPPSIKEAALGVGASHQQAIFHHVLPMAMPGIMTGTIIGMAHALGETAPLLMIGMVAFIVDIPGGITDAATALPVQIYLWSDLPEIAFQAKTAAAIIVLLVVLFVMNASAIYMRKRFERRW